MIATYDLSSVTDRLIEYLEQAIQDSPLWKENGGSIPRPSVKVTGLMPEVVRNDAGCQVSLYLFHVSPAPSTRNTPIDVSRAQENKSQPFGLTLFYLLSAHAKKNSDQEQQVMGIALKAFHEKATFIDKDPKAPFDFTITLEPESPDEANRRWQSFSTSFRLSAVYRVSVVFLPPAVTPAAPGPPLKEIGLAVAPGWLPLTDRGALVATASVAGYAGTPHKPETVTYHYTPAIVPPGGTFTVLGDYLDQPTAARLYLAGASLPETEVPWTVSGTSTSQRFARTLPSTFGPPPTKCPDPGIYLLRVGSSVAAGDGEDYRSNPIPLLISALVDPVPSPWTSVAGVYKFTGAGFVAGTQVSFDTVSLKPLPLDAAPGNGEFSIASDRKSVRFKPPAHLPAGAYYVRLRVGGVEGPPVGRIDLP